MNIVICKTKEEIGNLVSEVFIELVKSNPKCILGLATGSTPVPTYQAIIAKAKAQGISFKNVKSFNLDEYINNPDFAQSYKYFMTENLFKGIDILEENTHFPNEQLLDKYDDEIERAGGVDLQILGIGSDGHIAFNEPNTPFSSKTHVTDLTEQTIKDNARFFARIEDVPTQAITMGISTILKSRKIVLIATGKNKAQAVYDAINTYGESCAASALQKHPDVTFYLDEEAASLLNK